MKKTTHTLAIEIDTAIQLIVTATRNATLVAVEEAFRDVGQLTPSTATNVGRVTPSGGPNVQRRRPHPRRSTSEISELAERLFASLSEHPGKTMVELSQAMDAQPSDLRLPMVQLKRDGRVKSIGRRQYTRYYPRAAAQSDEALEQEAA